MLEHASKMQWSGNSQIFKENLITVSWVGKGSYAAVTEGNERVYYPVVEGANFGVGPTVQFDNPLDIYKKWNHYPVTVWLMDNN